MEYHELPSKMFCLTVLKKIVQESFSVSFNFGYRNDLCIRGLCHDFLPEIFGLTVSKKSVQESLGVSLISIIEIFYALEK